MNQKQKGFVNVALIIVVIVIIVVGGYFVFSKKSEIVPQAATDQTQTDRYQPTDFIRVPNESIQRVVIGHIYTIAWPLDAPEITSSSKVTITLINVSYPHKIQMELFKNTPANKLVQWTVPTNLPSSDWYQLNIDSCNNPSGQIRECINLGVVTLGIYKESLLPSVKLVPHFGSEIMRRGSIYKIQWVTQNVPDGIDAVLSFINISTKASYAIRNISNVGRSSGTYEWQIPLSIQPGNYIIQIALGGYNFKQLVPNGCFENKCFDESYYKFTIPE